MAITEVIGARVISNPFCVETGVPGSVATSITFGVTPQPGDLLVVAVYWNAPEPGDVAFAQLTSTDAAYTATHEQSLGYGNHTHLLRHGTVLFVKTAGVAESATWNGTWAARRNAVAIATVFRSDGVGHSVYLVNGGFVDGSTELGGTSGAPESGVIPAHARVTGGAAAMFLVAFQEMGRCDLGTGVTTWTPGSPPASVAGVSGTLTALATAAYSSFSTTHHLPFTAALYSETPGSPVATETWAFSPTTVPTDPREWNTQTLKLVEAASAPAGPDAFPIQPIDWTQSNPTYSYDGFFGDDLGFRFGDVPAVGDLMVVAFNWLTKSGDPDLIWTPPSGWSFAATTTGTLGAGWLTRVATLADTGGVPDPVVHVEPLRPHIDAQVQSFSGAGFAVGSPVFNAHTDNLPLTASLTGAGAPQMLLVLALDLGSDAAAPIGEPSLQRCSGDFQLLRDGRGGFGPLFAEQEDSGFPAAPNYLAQGLYMLADPTGGNQSFSVTPYNYDGNGPLPQTRPWMTSWLVVTGPVAAITARLTQTALEVASLQPTARLTQALIEAAFPASPVPANPLSHCWDGRAAQLLAYLGAPFKTDLTGRLGTLFRAIARELSGCLELVTFDPTTDARAAPGGVAVRFDPVTAVYRVQQVDAFGAPLVDYAVGPPDGRTIPVLGTPPVAGDRLSVAYTYQHEGLEARLQEALAQLNLGTAVGEFLDRWGAWFAVPRLAGEADGNYARRIMATVTASRNTRTAIVTAVQALTGPAAYMVEWFEALGGAWIWKPGADPVWRGGDAARHLVWGQTSRFGATDLSLAPCTFAVYFDCTAGISKAQVQAVIDRLKAAGTQGFARCLVSDVPVHLTQTVLETASQPISRGRVTQLAIESASLPRIDPASLPHLELYLDSRTLTGLTNGQSLGTWLDSSGLGRHCANAGNVFYRAGASPQGVGLVGIDEPGFLSPGACMTQSAGSLAFTNTRGVTLYIWYKLTSEITLTGDGQDPLLFQVPVSPSLTVHAPGGAITSPTDFGHAHFQWKTTGGFADGGRGVPGDYTFSLELPAGGTGGNARQNGAAYGPQAVNWSVVFSGNPYSVGDGSNAQWQSAFQVGAIALFSDAHSIDTRLGVERFLSDTWG